MKSNVEIIQDTIEQVVNPKKIDMWDQYFSPDYLSRGAPHVGVDTPNDQAKSDLREFMTKEFPDLMATIKLILADGDMVVCLLEYCGTHAGFEREVVWREAWFARLSEGKIIEGWPIIDESSYCRQLGYQLIPPGT